MKWISLGNILKLIRAGTIGHVDHGKVQHIRRIHSDIAVESNHRLDHIDCRHHKRQADKGLANFLEYGAIDKAPEERKRGITISTAHIEYSTEAVTTPTSTAPVTPITLRT